MDPNVTPRSLGEAARIVARAADLDSKLDALAIQVAAQTRATAVVLFVHDPNAGTIVPAAAAGLPDVKLGEQTISTEDENDLAARVVRDRQLQRGNAAGSWLLAASVPEAVTVLGVPLVSVDIGGAQEAEGALLAAYDVQVGDDVEQFLEGLADMCAVAIRQARLEHALTERADWLNQLATSDPLTGLANRVTFERTLEMELARARRQELPVSLVLFDVAGLAAIDRRVGGRAGDDILRHVAAVISEQVRVVDSVARVGGDEFGVVALGGGGEIVARRIREAIARRQSPTGEPIGVHTGVAVFPGAGDSAAELMAAAQAALDAERTAG